MKVMSPFDLLHMFYEMEPGERKVYYVGAMRYDRGESIKKQKSIKLWKLSSTTRLLEKEGYAVLCMKRVGEFTYQYYIQKRTGVDRVPEWIEDRIEELEHKESIL